jgi:AhpD family alkylhydroperoxidase
MVPKAAVGAGVFEALTAGPSDLDARSLAVARVVASGVGGCPFCIDMNAAAGPRNGLTADEVATLLDPAQPDVDRLGRREAIVARYARALSLTPTRLDDPLRAALTGAFTPRELVALTHTIAQVSYWTRFNQGLGIPSAGFLDVASDPDGPARGLPPEGH